MCMCVPNCDLETTERGTWARFSALESAGRAATSVDSPLVYNINSQYCTPRKNHVALNTRVENFHFFCLKFSTLINLILLVTLLRNVQNASGAQAPKRSVQEVFTPGVRGSWDGSVHSPCLMPRVKTCGALPPFTCEHRKFCMLTHSLP